MNYKDWQHKNIITKPSNQNKIKNLHLLPTEKPSRVYKEESIYKLDNLVYGTGNQNIYITSDEEIKDGNWFYVKTHNIHKGNIVAKCLGFGKDCWSENILTDATDEKGYHPSHCVKIILTTDQDLIKDGVQAIPDYFLESFVKNPSCEEVEVDLVSVNEFGSEVTVNGYGFDNFIYKIIIPKEEPKQETLEEAANKQWGNIHRTGVLGFIDGAKWQQQRSYGKDEVLKLLRESHFVQQNIEE